MKIEELIKQKAFSSDLERALVNIMYTSNWFRDKQTHIFKKHNLLAQHYNILRIVKGKHPDPISPTEINAVLLDKSNDTTRLIDKLIRMHLVRKNLCPTNRRKMDVTITTEGIEILGQLNVKVKEIMSEIGNKLNVAETIVLSNLLDKIRED